MSSHAVRARRDGTAGTEKKDDQPGLAQDDLLEVTCNPPFARLLSLQETLARSLRRGDANNAGKRIVGSTERYEQANFYVRSVPPRLPNQRTQGQGVTHFSIPGSLVPGMLASRVANVERTTVIGTKSVRRRKHTWLMAPSGPTLALTHTALESASIALPQNRQIASAKLKNYPNARPLWRTIAHS
jgi:hypothetical protein